MLRISKLTDYAIILMVYIGKNCDVTYRASELAVSTNISAPTVAKLLKKLTKAKLLQSARGALGGYKLALEPADISVADIIACIEGPVGLTQCSVHEHLCDISNVCNLKLPWIHINSLILNTLKNYNLNELISVTNVPKHQRINLKQTVKSETDE